MVIRYKNISYIKYKTLYTTKISFYLILMVKGTKKAKKDTAVQVEKPKEENTAVDSLTNLGSNAVEQFKDLVSTPSTPEVIVPEVQTVAPSVQVEDKKPRKKRSVIKKIQNEITESKGNGKEKSYTLPLVIVSFLVFGIIIYIKRDYILMKFIEFKEGRIIKQLEKEGLQKLELK